MENNVFNFITTPSENLGVIVTIPCCNEPDLISTLKSLISCSFEKGKFEVEVLIMINASENSDSRIKDQNLKTFEEGKQWVSVNKKDGIEFYFALDNEMPKKHAGVGLARRMAMDQAYNRFEEINKLDGVIVCYDADSSCDENYLAEIYSHFLKFPKTPGCSIYYEHPTAGEQYSEDIYQAIVYYETHLRYYNLCLNYCNYPGAYHTVGSSMAVRAFPYRKQGGMNKRKAGEDFYFLHKIISLGNFTELNSTKVIPSPRESDRVPFGTGRAVATYLKEAPNEFSTYALQSFCDLKVFFSFIEDLYSGSKNFSDIPISLQEFINKDVYNSKIDEINKNSTNFNSFKKRFFVWFNAFTILKFVHFSRDNYYENGEIVEEVNKLLNAFDLQTYTSDSCRVLLENIRVIERNKIV